MDPVDPRSGSGEQPLIVLRVVIRSPDVETFIAKYSRFLKDDRIFIFTKASQPPGTRVRFTLELADGPPLLNGEGTVTRIRPDQGDPSRPPGMELRFVPIDEDSRKMVARMTTQRGTSQLPLSQPIKVGKSSDNSVGTQLGTNPGTQAPTNPGDPSKRTRIDDAPTKIRTGESALPVHTPAHGTNLPTTPRIEVIASREERTDVDGQRKKFDATPPAFMTTPTPLPAPLPLPSVMTPPHGTSAPDFSEPKTKNEKMGELKLTHPQLPTLQPTPALGLAVPALAVDQSVGRAEENTGAFVTDDGSPAPRFAESYVGALPAPPGAPPPAGTVPANPFAEISDNTIEYFVAWSLEQSTTPHPKSKPPPEASFANVEIRAPGRERDTTAAVRLRLYIGVLVGLAFGIPLGAVGMWAFRPFGRSEDAWVLPRAQRAVAANTEAQRPVVETTQPVIVRPTPDPPAPKAAAPVAVAEKHAVDGDKHSTESDKHSAADEPSEAATKPPSAKTPEKPAAPSTARPSAATASKPAATTKPPGTAQAKAPAAKPSGPAASESPAPAAPPEGASDPAVAAAAGKPTAPATKPTADEPKPADELPSPPSLAVHKGRTATLRVRSTPAGAEVTIRGQGYGVTPVDVELPPGHRYEVVVTLNGKKPWKRRINLDPPLTEVSASLK
jgi:Tfp pilus assembly protein PilZ